MPPSRPTFASLGLAPLILRVVIGLTFLWTGLGKWNGTAIVQGDDAALLANLDIIPRTPPAAAPIPGAPAAPLPAPTTLAPEPAAPTAGLLILAQSSPAAPTKPVPVTAGPPVATAADFPEPVSCRAMWRIAILIHRAAHPAPPSATSANSSAAPAPPSAAPMPTWPPIIGTGLWPKVFAISVFVAELGGGICLLLGLFTRLAAFSTAGIMLGAIWLTQIGPAIQSGRTLLGFLPVREIWDPQAWMPLAWQISLLGSSLAVVCLGCGVLAVDRAISGYRAVPERFQRSTPPPSSGAPRGAAK